MPVEYMERSNTQKIPLVYNDDKFVFHYACDGEWFGTFQADQIRFRVQEKVADMKDHCVAKRKPRRPPGR